MESNGDRSPPRKAVRDSLLVSFSVQRVKRDDVADFNFSDLHL